MTKVYVVRHPEAQGNVERFFQGSTNCDVTELGKKQLEFLSERFKSIHLDSIYSSPLIRAYKTAEAINKYHNLKIIKDKNIAEIDGGDLEGMHYKDIYTSLPEIYDMWENKPYLFEFKNAESMRHFHKRVVNEIISIAKKNKDKTAAVATHGCAIRSIVCFAKGLDITDLKKIDYSPNTGVSLIEFNDDFKPDLKYTADITHLPKEYVSTFKVGTYK